MKQMILQQWVLDKMKSDPILFGKVGYILGISSMTLPKMIMLNDRRLTQASVLRILREHLGIKKDTDLLEEAKEKLTA